MLECSCVWPESGSAQPACGNRAHHSVHMVIIAMEAVFTFKMELLAVSVWRPEPTPAALALEGPQAQVQLAAPPLTALSKGRAGCEIATFHQMGVMWGAGASVRLGLPLTLISSSSPSTSCHGHLGQVTGLTWKMGTDTCLSEGLAESQQRVALSPEGLSDAQERLRYFVPFFPTSSWHCEGSISTCPLMAGRRGRPDFPLAGLWRPESALPLALPAAGMTAGSVHESVRWLVCPCSPRRILVPRSQL